MATSVKTLIRKVTESEDAGALRTVLIELGYAENDAVYPILIAQLDAANASVQHAAVISLARHGNAAAIEYLVKPKILQSPITNVRWAAVAALGKLGDYRIIDHLLKAADDPEWVVRNQSVTVLKEKIQEIIERRDIRLARILIRLLALDHDEIVNLVIEGFVDLGLKSLDLLMDAATGPSSHIRRNAARALGEIGDEQSLPRLIDMLQDSEWTVREAAATSLGQIRDKRAVEPLVQALRDNVGRVQRAARRSLPRFGKLATAPLLHALTYEKNKFTLRAMILALGEIGDLKSVPALMDYLSSGYFVVRRAAQRALTVFGPPIVEALIPKLSYNRSDISALLKDANDRKNLPLQVRAVKALGGLEDHRAVLLLKRLVDDGRTDVQDAAVQALIQIGCAAWGRCGVVIVLGEIGDASVVPHLAPSLLDDSANVRLEAVRALARVDEIGAVKPLMGVAKKDSDPYIRFEAVRLLRQIGVGHPPVLDLAFAALKDNSRDVRAQAAALLGNFQDNRSIRPLLGAMADSHWSVRESAENALHNFGERAVKDLIAALSGKSWTTRFRAARALGEIGDQRALVPLENLLKKKGERKRVKEVARLALDKLRGKLAA